MGSASNYWHLVYLDGTGYRKVEEVAIAKMFFYQQFAEFAGQSDVPDAAIQQRLFVMQSGHASLRSSEPNVAEYCLRCFISHQIEQVCVQLEIKFGTRHGFTRFDLFPFVLNDESHWMVKKRASTHYQPFSSEILQTFDPNRAGLSTWVMRQVRHHRELRAFLHEHGVYLATDWGILNDTSPDQLRSVLTGFYSLTPAEIEPACWLLRGYHQVYRRDRLQKRQLGLLKGKETCLPPTPEQLARIAQYLQEQNLPIQSTLPSSSDSILGQLQVIAAKLRQYRLHRLGKPLTAESLDQLDMQAIASVISTDEPNLNAQEEQDFLDFFHKQTLECLDQSLERATNDRVTYLQQRKGDAAQKFLIALKLFHCQGYSMSEIASKIGLQAQFQVSRLMKLKEFRASVRSHFLQHLLESILDRAKMYTDPTYLQKNNQSIEFILSEHIDILMKRAEAEAAIAKQRPLDSFFSRRLCHHLDTRTTTL